MGVRGWNSLLAREGWLVQRETSDGIERTDTLWMNPRDPHHSSLLLDHVEPIPPNSELHIDGMGLCFHLHAAAYQRCVSTTSLSRSGSMHLLRTFVPLKDLSDITVEFIRGLLSSGIEEIQVYWDGKARPRFKAETQNKRQTSRDEEWAVLQTYCRSGGRLPRKGLSRAVPISPLAFEQIRHTLSCLDVPMVQCEGEADIDMARAVTDHPERYVVANDTDFCFMESISYIPLSTLHIVGNNAMATVLKRERLAESFGLASEALLVEAALLLGNDYYQPEKPTTSDEVIEYLQEQDADFRVEVSNERDRERLGFVRNHYSLEDSVHALGPDNATTQHGADFEPREDGAKPSYRINKALLEPFAAPSRYGSMKGAIIECLERYAHDEPDDFSREHIQAFIDMNVDTPVTLSHPKWPDVVASYILECTILRFYRQEGAPPEAPYEIYPSAIQFFESLHRNRNPVAVPPPVKSPGQTPRLEVSAPKVLPVDEFEDRIIDSVRRNRVTIVQGGTGCGKSTRVPLMLLQQSPDAKIFICQPRRLAVKSIVDYLRKAAPESLRNQIALRMGHGIREYENSLTRAWFVTTGYLVRLLANAPERFDSVDVLIIDEVHERSVDTDILCLLCKRLMAVNRSIRLVLMSATMAATMYQRYFESTESPIKVGFKRFPIKEVFIEDIIETLDLPAEEEAALASLGSACMKMQGKDTPNVQYMEKLCASAASLATIIGSPGSSVLVFVSGMFDIVRISEAIAKIFIANKRIKCCPIHSEIPFEEQQLALVRPEEDEVKIIIATNAAESSLTIPEVDNVICLGLCKQLSYNAKSHRQMLVPAWISQANAIQRAGRTGRVAPGTIYRLYPRHIYENEFEPFEMGEMLRIPLDSVVLMLKEIIPQSESVTTVLRSCLEPPDLDSIGNSLRHLHKSRFTTTANDDCGITELGKFVLALGIDLSLGSLIGLGIQFGVGSEAIQLAGVLSCDKGPWLISNPLVHPIDQYNGKWFLAKTEYAHMLPETTRLTWSDKVAHDNGLFSDGFTCLDILQEFERIPRNQRRQWSLQKGIFLPRLIRMQSTCQDLAARVANFLRIDDSNLSVFQPPRLMPSDKVRILRIIQAFPQSIIRFTPNDSGALYKNIEQEKQSLTMVVRTQNGTLTEDHLKTVLLTDTHPFTWYSKDRARVHGTFETLNINRPETDEKRRERLWSFAADKDFAAAWYQHPDGKEIWILRRTDFILNDPLIQIAMSLDATSSAILLTEQTDKSLRGIKERPCGRWVAVPFESADPDLRSKQLPWEWLCFSGDEVPSSRNRLQNEFQRSATNCRADVVSLFFPKQKGNSNKTRFEFTVTGKSQGISDQDLEDILISQRIVHTRVLSSAGTNELTFRNPEDEITPQSNPVGKLYDSIPDGARLFLTIASGWRSKHAIQFSQMMDYRDIVLDPAESPSETNRESEAANPEDSISVLLPECAKLVSLWKTFDSGSDPLEVVVDSSSTAASAIPLAAPTPVTPVYAVCGSVLELRKGLRVSNLTVLPPENQFLCLAQLSFGLVSVDELYSAEPRGDTPDLTKADAADMFNQSCSFMGEKLQCFPEKVTELLALFSAEDDYTPAPELTENLNQNPFTASNLLKLQKAHKEGVRSAKLAKQNQRSASLSTGESRDSEQTCPAKMEPSHHRSLAQLFATDSTEPLEPDKLYASNLMSLIVQATRGTPVCLDDWDIASTKPSKLWRAFYSESVFLPANNGCAWDATASNARPIQINEALRCLPSKMRPFYFHKMKAVDDTTLMFESLEVAIQMEAAFWLERQFHTLEAHWYQRGGDVHEMIQALKQRMNE